MPFTTKPPTNIAPPPSKTPKGPSSSAMARATEKARSDRFNRREDGLNNWGTILVGGFLATGQYADAGATAVHFPNVARETAALSEDYESVANVVDKVVAAGPFAALLSAVIPWVMQILVNHDKMPASPLLAQMKVLPKEALEAQGKATALKLAAEAMRAQQEAEAELIAIQAEMLSQNGSEPAPETAPV